MLNTFRLSAPMVVEASTLIEVDIDTFEEMIRRNIEVAVRVMRKLAARVRELDRRVEKLLIDNALGRTLEVLRWLLPQGILWEQEDWFTGRSESADTITKFRLPDGVTWTERKANLR